MVSLTSSITTAPLSPDLTRAVLDYLGVQAVPPTLSGVDALLSAYIRIVPWETASRIAKHACTANTADCPRWPDEFWRDALERGTGGTCFETNYAFFSLLRALSFEGYLTINNRNDDIACHTAIVLNIDGKPLLVDAGMPLFMTLPLDATETTQHQSPFLDYTVRPIDPNRYLIERQPHPRPHCFTLINIPVADADYRAAMTADYGEKGLFLDHVIVNKILGEQQWRFSSSEHPYRLEVFTDGERIDHPIEGDPARVIAHHFGMDESVLHAAFESIGD